MKAIVTSVFSLVCLLIVASIMDSYGYRFAMVLCLLLCIPALGLFVFTLIQKPVDVLLKEASLMISTLVLEPIDALRNKRRKDACDDEPANEKLSDKEFLSYWGMKRTAGLVAYVYKGNVRLSKKDFHMLSELLAPISPKLAKQFAHIKERNAASIYNCQIHSEDTLTQFNRHCFVREFAEILYAGVCAANFSEVSFERFLLALELVEADPQLIEYHKANYSSCKSLRFNRGSVANGTSTPKNTAVAVQKEEDDTLRIEEH